MTSPVIQVKPSVAMLGMVLTIVGSMLSGAWMASTRAAQIESNTVSRTDHEQRIHKLELQSATTAADIRWIREALKNAGFKAPPE